MLNIVWKTVSDQWINHSKSPCTNVPSWQHKAVTVTTGVASSFVQPKLDCWQKSVTAFTVALWCQYHVARKVIVYKITLIDKYGLLAAYKSGQFRHVLLASLRFDAVDATMRMAGDFHSCCNSSQQSSSTTRHQYHIGIRHILQDLQCKTTKHKCLYRMHILLLTIFANCQ